MISQETRDELRRQLLSDRQRLEREISNLGSSGVRADVFQTDEMTDVVDQHPADEGSELFEREKNMTLQRELEATLHDVNDALDRIEGGTYGVCENCGNEIPEKRLRAIPEARYDIACQAQIEKRQGVASRP